MKNINDYINNGTYVIKETIEDNNVIRLVEVYNTHTYSDEYIIFDIKTGNIIAETNSSDFGEIENLSDANMVYNALNNFIKITNLTI